MSPCVFYVEERLHKKCNIIYLFTYTFFIFQLIFLNLFSPLQFIEGLIKSSIRQVGTQWIILISQTLLSRKQEERSGYCFFALFQWIFSNLGAFLRQHHHIMEKIQPYQMNNCCPLIAACCSHFDFLPFLFGCSQALLHRNLFFFDKLTETDKHPK